MSEVEEALQGLLSAIDKKVAYLNPGRQTENWFSPVLEDAIAKAREALDKATVANGNVKEKK